MPRASPTATTTAEQGRRAGTEREGLHVLVWGQLGQVRRDRRGRRPDCARLEGRRGAVLVPCRRPAGTHPMAAHPGALTMGPDPPARCRSASGGNLHPPGQQPRVREPPWGWQVPARGDHRGRAARTPHGLASPSRGRHRASGAVRQEGAKRRCRARAGEEGISYFRARRDRCCCAAAAFNPLCPPQRCRGVAEGVPGVRPALGAQLPLGSGMENQDANRAVVQGGGSAGARPAGSSRPLCGAEPRSSGGCSGAGLGGTRTGPGAAGAGRRDAGTRGGDRGGGSGQAGGVAGGLERG